MTTISHGAHPRRRPQLRKCRHESETLLVDRDGRRVCGLNATALALWELCDGATSPEEMADAVAELCGLSPVRAIEDVRTALATLEGLGALVVPRPGDPEHVRDAS
jgi:hypothetical protein